MHKHNFKNFIKCHCLHVRKWFCGLLAAQIILIPSYSFAQINSDITVQQMNNSFGVSAFDLTNYNLALNLNFGNKHPDTTYGALTAIYRGLAQAFGPAYYYEIQSNTLNSPARYSETQNVLRSLQAVEQNQWYMNQNLISSDTYLSNLNSKLTTQNSLLTTQNSLLYDYNHDGNAAFSIGSTSRNTAVNTQTLVNQLKTSNWVSATTFQGVTNSYGGSFIDLTNTINNASYSDLYWYFDNFNIAGQNMYKIVLPTRSSAQNNLNRYIDYIDVIGSNGSKVNADYVLEYDYASNRIIIYLTNFVPFVQGYPFIIHVHYLYNFNIFSSITPTVEYCPYDSFAYFLRQDNLYLRSINDKQDDIIDTIENKDFTATIDGGDFTLIVPVLDPDVEFNMDVDLTVGDQDDITDLVNDTKDLTETGVDVQQLLDTLNDVLELFFNQQNKNTVETISTQYHTYN